MVCKKINKDLFSALKVNSYQKQRFFEDSKKHYFWYCFDFHVPRCSSLQRTFQKCWFSIWV